MTHCFVSPRLQAFFAVSLLALCTTCNLNASPLLLGGDSANGKAADVQPAQRSIFAVTPSLAVGGKPAAVALADLNGDGNLDLIAVNEQGNMIDVLLGRGHGGLQAPVHYKVGASPVAIVVGDFDGDGKVDVAVANKAANSVSILLGNGDGTLRSAVTYSVGIAPVALAVGDFNATGRVSLVVANEGSNSLSLLKNKGDGTFQDAIFVSLAATPKAIVVGNFTADGNSAVVVGHSNGTLSLLVGDSAGSLRVVANVTSQAKAVSALVAADLNHDGNLDLAVADPSESSITVLLGNGDGTFRPAGLQLVGNHPVALVVDDLDKDGNPDLVVLNRDGNTVSVLLGDGRGNFADGGDFVVGNTPRALVAGDVDGDGHADLVAANEGDGTLTTLIGNGDGTFQAPRDYRTHLSRKSIAVGDLNRDGHPDAVVSSLCGADLKCDGPGTATVFLSDGEGGLRPGSTVILGNGPVALDLADVYGDRKLDLIAVNRDDDTISVLAGNGDGTFQPGVKYAATGHPVAMAVGDFNRDGKPDLAIVSQCGSQGCGQRGSVSILFGRADGSFATGPSFDVGFSPVSVSIGDVDGDAKLDLVVANACGENAACSSGSASVLIGDGRGSFNLQSVVLFDKRVAAAVLADLNGRGTLDLIVSHNADGQISVARGNGDGSFVGMVAYPVDRGPSALVVADFDGDGRKDIAVANLSSSTVSLLRGNGDGTLKPAVNFTVGAGPEGLAALDLPGSGQIALVSANSGGIMPGNDITVLVSNAPTKTTTTTTTTTLTSSSSTSVYGDTITFTATVSGGTGITGSVNFLDNPDPKCLGKVVTSLGTVAIDSSDTTDREAVLSYSKLDVAGSPHCITAMYTGNFPTSTSKALTQTVTKATPTVTWSNPADITYGVALSGTQLNATFSAPGTTTSLPGTAVYTPLSGTVLKTMSGQKLSVMFTPTDTTNYTTATATVTINVKKATPTVTWSNPADITYGVALSGTQLNATFSAPGSTTSLPGTAVYAPLSGKVLNAMSGQTLSVMFTPTDTTNYTTAMATVTINVNPATLTVKADSLSRKYGDMNPLLTYTITGFFNGEDKSVVKGVPTLATAATESSDTFVGSYTITVTQNTLAATNYMFKLSVGTLTVTPATLTVMPNPSTRFYGAANPMFTTTFTGFQYSDTQAGGATTGMPSCTSAAAFLSNVGTYDITCTTGGLTAKHNNYLFTFITLPKGLAVTAAPTSVDSTSMPLTLSGTMVVITANLGFNGAQIPQNDPVQFVDQAPGASACASTPTVGNGISTCSLAISDGPHQITVQYNVGSPDLNFQPIVSTTTISTIPQQSVRVGIDKPTFPVELGQTLDSKGVAVFGDINIVGFTSKPGCFVLNGNMLVDAISEGILCSFDKSVLTLTSSSNQINVTVQTNQTTVGAANTPNLPGRAQPILMAGGWMAGMIGIVLVIPRSRKRSSFLRKRLLLGLGGAIMFCMLLMAASCGGGFNNKFVSGQTATGRHTLYIKGMGTDSTGNTTLRTLSVIDLNVI